MATVISHKQIPSIYGDNESYHRYEFAVLIGGKTIIVESEDGQYDYEEGADVPEDDEPIQVAIGEYIDQHDIDTGKISR